MSEPATPSYGAIPEWTLGWRLKRALDFADLTAQDMAAELGVHVGTISRWMNDRETPRRAYTMAWALRTGVPFGWITGEEGLPVAHSSDIRIGIRDDSHRDLNQAEIKALMKRIPLVRSAADVDVRRAVR